MRTDEGPWIVHTKGGPDREVFEIALVRARNRHGQQSFGWFGPSKRLVSQGSDRHERVSEALWEKLVAVAKEMAETLNALESPPTA